MFQETAIARELTKRSGRVYQICADQWKVAIDWVPPSPILGCTVLYRGQAEFHPTEGKVVRFPQALRRRRGTATIAVRTGNRPDLLELFNLATELEAKLLCEFELLLEVYDVDRVDPLLELELPRTRAKPPRDKIRQKEPCPIFPPPEHRAEVAAV